MSCRIDGKWGLIFTYGPGNNDVVSRGSLKKGEARKLGYTYGTNGGRFKHFERARGKPSFSSQTVRLVKAYELESREMQNLLELLLC